MLQRHLLKDADVEALAPGVYDTLEKVGMMYQNEEMLAALAAAGATVDDASQRATFPREMTQEHVEQFQREAAAEPDAAGPFQAPGAPGIGTQVAQFYYDDVKQEKRSSNRRDMVTLIRLGEALHGDQGVGHCLSLTDVPPMLEPLEAGMLLAEHARKPLPPFAWNVRQVDYLIEMGQILGIESWFTWGANCIAHPLRFDKDVADKFVRRVKTGAGASLCAMPVAGISTPVTLAGFITVTTAEFLAVWMAGRALNPDTALSGGMWAGTPDMRTGQVSYCASDAMLYGFASVEFVRRFCGLTVHVGGGEYCDAKVPGLYAALEKAYKAMTIAAFSGQHPGTGSGMLEEGKTLSPVQMMLERDLATGVGQFGRTVDASPEAVALDTILDVGFGIQKNYLESDHTSRHFRECLWLPRIIDRSGWAGFGQERAMLGAARQAVGDYLAAYRQPEVDPGKLARMRQVVDRARRELG